MISGGRLRLQLVFKTMYIVLSDKNPKDSKTNICHCSYNIKKHPNKTYIGPFAVYENIREIITQNFI